MKGESAVPSVKTIRRPISNSRTTIGRSQYFLRILMKSQKSLRTDNLPTCYFISRKLPKTMQSISLSRKHR